MSILCVTTTKLPLVYRCIQFDFSSSKTNCSINKGYIWTKKPINASSELERVLHLGTNKTSKRVL